MAEPTLHNSIREKMLRDEVAYTLSVKLVRTIELPMMAKTAGFDGILIDMEHSTFDLDTTSTFTSSPTRPISLPKKQT
jgi:2-keto-3-deoxy-L-rhamnonate aldolase RhmA